MRRNNSASAVIIMTTALVAVRCDAMTSTLPMPA